MDSQFPRLKSRGSIEAGATRDSVVRDSVMFPRLKSRGSIEAKNGEIKDPRYSSFPRLKSRGSIEAYLGET